MGATLYVALDRNIDNIEINNDRVFLANLVGDRKAMDALCSKLGVSSLSDFQSYDPQMVAQFLHDPEAIKAAVAKSPPIQWFNPTDALPTVRALQAHYAQIRFVQERGRRRKVAGKVEWEPLDRTEDLLRELRDLEAILSHATISGGKFRIFMGF
jgi:hypothetical protein